MSDQSNKFSSAYRGSLGLKLIIVCALVVLMGIPAMFISYISYERSGRADEVMREVSARYGGEQYISGPILTAPYIQTDNQGNISESGNYVIFANNGHADFSNIQTEIRKRSLFKVPTYQGQGVLTGDFPKIPSFEGLPGLKVDWGGAKIVMALSDVRGLKSDVELTLPNGSVRKFEPAGFDNTIHHGVAKVAAHDAKRAIIEAPELHASNRHLTKGFRAYGWLNQSLSQTYLSVPIGDIAKKGDAFNVSVALNLGGAKRLGVTPYAQSTTVNMSVDWADPGFEGGFPPDSRDVSKDGFTANWSVPYLRRGIRAQGKAHLLSALTGPEKIMTVQLVSTDNPYQTVNRALKYAVMFIGLVFISYFLFEVIVGVRVHPAQYILIGLAQSIFYLLLLAFAERIGFTAAFFIAAGLTVSATAGYAGAVFGNRKYILRAGLVFSVVYALLYSLMRMQDFALMIGALASFIAIAGTMYLTRNMNWYGLTDAPLKRAQ